MTTKKSSYLLTSPTEDVVLSFQEKPYDGQPITRIWAADDLHDRKGVSLDELARELNQLRARGWICVGVEMEDLPSFEDE